MWSAGSEDLYLSDCGVYVDDPGAKALRSFPGAGWADALRAWSSDLAARPRRPLRRTRLKVWLSGTLARPFMLAPLQGLDDPREAAILAAAAAPEATGLEGGCTVWMGPWHPGHGGVAVVVRKGLIDALRGCEDRLPLRLAAVEPWWNWVLTRHLAHGHTDGLLAVEEKDAVTLLGCGGGWLQLAQSLVPRPSAERLHQQLRRHAMAQGREPETVVRACHRASRPQAGEQRTAGGAVVWQVGCP